MHPREAKQSNALMRINTLFEQAAIRPAYAKRYIALARKIGQRTRTSIPQTLKLRMCKTCNAYLNTKTSTTRVKNGRRIIVCSGCGTTKRIPLGGKKKLRQSANH